MIRALVRFLAFLYAQRVRGFVPPEAEPFMDQEGKQRFREELSKASYYLEFGSGGTTVLADRSGIPTISVESDRFYARAVARRLCFGCVEQIVVDLGFSGQWGTPLFSTRVKGLRYATAPFGGPFPDFILVDGRYRVACALESARRAYQTGNKAVLMFDDYATRPHYHRVERYLGSPEKVGRAAIFNIGARPVLGETVEDACDDKR